MKSTDAPRSSSVAAVVTRLENESLAASRVTAAATPVSARPLWLWVLAGFLALGVCWFAMFKAAHSAQIREVPLATKGGRP